MRVNNRSVLLSALPAAIFYGALAALSNADHGIGAMSRAAIIQGLISYGSTLIALSAMFKLARVFTLWPLPVRRAVVPLTVVSLFTALSATLHMKAGTPNVLLTVAPSFLIGWGYFTMVYWLSDSKQPFRTPGTPS
ncbi:hypothetical protein NLK61_02070 [Pseudomonas fuscovaginae UPB0736]|uniref:hypothetical protein n=1 Tax=Pseudomonas asplenii TaxID=53407 RepID=UPI0002899794|nr:MULTISPECIES: hypothetical protein [Pseudomonas]UUQ65463.1 hypothetical protein NLK61_02070 [Pseudomonas fuscovaginae UPB0736]UZE31329.1 hypothetical protein LOY63_11610 [Pseudomonas asplenii]